MRAATLVHPLRNDAIAVGFPQTVTIQVQGGNAPNRTGAKNSAANWQDVTGLADLPCQISAKQVARELPGQGQGPASVSTHEILFDALHATITERHRAVDDATGQIYNVQVARRDPTSNNTILDVQLTSV